MPAYAGTRRYLFEVQVQGDEPDDWGNPPGWVTRGTIRGGIKSETGMGAIRSSLTHGLPQSVARYSVDARTAEVRALQIAKQYRLVNLQDGTIFSVTGVVTDYEDGTRSYVLCEVGGNEG